MIIPIDKFLRNNLYTVLIKTDFKIDLKPIKEFVDREVLPLQKTYQKNPNRKDEHGGWSVQSDTGEIHDGWQTGSYAFNMTDNGPVLDHEKRRKLYPNGGNFTSPTVLYKGAIQSLVNKLSSFNFLPKRTRFAELEAGGEDEWHVDNANVKPPGMWRGHLAIYTNPDAFFCWRSINGSSVKYHIPADGYLYLARLDLEHTVINHGVSNRIHIITDSQLPIEQATFKVLPMQSLIT